MSDGEWVLYDEAEVRYAACLTPDLEGPHEMELWNKIRADLKRLKREIEVWDQGESARLDAYAPGTLKEQAESIAATASELKKLIEGARPLIERMTGPEKPGPASCPTCGQVEGGVAWFYGTQPIESDLKILIKGCQAYLEAAARPDSPRRRQRRPPSSSYELHGLCWLYRNHIARLVTLRPDLLPYHEGRRSEGVEDWGSLAPADKETVWRDAELVCGAYELDFIAAVRWKEGTDEPPTSESVRRELSRYPYAATPVWRSQDLRVRPDLRDAERERHARARAHWPVYVPGCDYDCGPSRPDS